VIVYRCTQSRRNTSNEVQPIQVVYVRGRAFK
jgi:hypothetical protein